MSLTTTTPEDRDYIDELNAGVGTKAELTAHAELSNAEKNKGKIQDMRARLLAKLKAKKAAEAPAKKEKKEKKEKEEEKRAGRPICPSERQ